MLLAIVATVCHVGVAAQAPAEFRGPFGPSLRENVMELCHDELIVEADLPLQACTLGMKELADWKEHSRFADADWRIKRWRCTPGHYVRRDAV